MRRFLRLYQAHLRSVLQGIFAQVVSVTRLQNAWEKVRANDGCAGGDGETIDGFAHRAGPRLQRLSASLIDGTYRPRDLRVLHIPKRNGTRPLSIPSLEDRIVQTAVAQVLGPVLDRTFDPGSFGYRPGKSVIQAVRRIGHLRRRGYVHVVEADIVRCFERIPHAPVLDRLEDAIGEGQSSSRLLDLVAH